MKNYLLLKNIGKNNFTKNSAITEKQMLIKAFKSYFQCAIRDNFAAIPDSCPGWQLFVLSTMADEVFPKKRI